MPSQENKANDLPLSDAGAANLADVAKSALPAKEVSGWQKIETAPKDGTFILIGWFELPGQRSMHVAFWHSTLKAWCQTHSCFTTEAAWQPTHWMPLPSPPSSPETGEDDDVDASSPSGSQAALRAQEGE